MLNIDTGEVIGVVSSKRRPNTTGNKSALDALSQQRSGFISPRTYSDGRTEQISEGHIVASVLQYLRASGATCYWSNGYLKCSPKLSDYICCCSLIYPI